MFVNGPITLTAMSITGDPLFDFFFTLIVYCGVISAGIAALLNLFNQG